MDFQNVNPELFIVVGELLGNVLSNELPFNVQNAVGNWLQLVGQAIETYNAQQQYYQQGPGRYFTPDSFNVDNPHCQNKQGSSNQTSSNQGASSEDDVLPKSSRASTDSGSTPDIEHLVRLQETVELLMSRLEQLEKEIKTLKEMDRGKLTRVKWIFNMSIFVLGILITVGGDYS